MSIVRLFSIAFALTVTAACGASEPPAAGTQPNANEVPAPVVKASVEASDGHEVCVAAMRRQRECTDVFIPALVDARVRADRPAGIAAKDQEMGRAALVAGAREEWANDSTDEAIDATCSKAAGHPEMIEKAEACLAESACDAFSACTIDIISSSW
jgi:hypothetical protein